MARDDDYGVLPTAAAILSPIGRVANLLSLSPATRSVIPSWRQIELVAGRRGALRVVLYA